MSSISDGLPNVSKTTTPGQPEVRTHFPRRTSTKCSSPSHHPQSLTPSSSPARHSPPHRTCRSSARKPWQNGSSRTRFRKRGWIEKISDHRLLPIFIVYFLHQLNPCISYMINHIFLFARKYINQKILIMAKEVLTLIGNKSNILAAKKCTRWGHLSVANCGPLEISFFGSNDKFRSHLPNDSL